MLPAPPPDRGHSRLKKRRAARGSSASVHGCCNINSDNELVCSCGHVSRRSNCERSATITHHEAVGCRSCERNASSMGSSGGRDSGSRRATARRSKGRARARRAVQPCRELRRDVVVQVAAAICHLTPAPRPSRAPPLPPQFVVPSCASARRPAKARRSTSFLCISRSTASRRSSAMPSAVLTCRSRGSSVVLSPCGCTHPQMSAAHCSVQRHLKRAEQRPRPRGS